MSIFEEIRARVNIVDVAKRFGVELNSANKALCPFHDEKTPSFSVKSEENFFKCFGCGESGDAVALVAKLQEVSPIEAARQIAGQFGIDFKENHKTKNSSVKNKASTQSKKVATKNCQVQTKQEKLSKAEMKSYLVDCQNDVFLTDYFAKRGLTAETCKRFRLGFDKRKNHAIVPYSPALNYYLARGLTGKFFQKPERTSAGEEPLFNVGVLKKDKPVFVVEGPFCAISIAQCGANALSLCGTENANKLVKEYNKLSTKPPLILSLDNDEAGAKACDKLAYELDKLGAIFIPFNISGDCKDPNELLVKDAAQLKSNIEKALCEIKKAKPKFNRDRAITAAELMALEIPPTKWFVDDIMPEGLHILAAPSKAGKSWMMIQLAFALAEGKEFLGKTTSKAGTIYFALEDSPSRLQQRMLKMKMTPTQNVVLKTTAKTLQSGFLEELVQLLKEFPNTGLVIVDTLQIIRDGAVKNEGVYATDYREMRVLKDFVQDKKVSILLVHHLRKMNDTDSFNRISGSTALMGACDTVFTMTKDKRSDENTVLELTGRDVSTQKLIISFDKTSYLWEQVGDVETQLQRKQQAEYQNNDIVKTIKMLLKMHPTGWSGKIEEFCNESAKFLQHALPFTFNVVAKQIKSLEPLLAADGITHIAPTGGGRKGRIHTFYWTDKIYKQVALDTC